MAREKERLTSDETHEQRSTLLERFFGSLHVHSFSFIFFFFRSRFLSFFHFSFQQSVWASHFSTLMKSCRKAKKRERKALREIKKEKENRESERKREGEFEKRKFVAELVQLLSFVECFLCWLCG